MRNFNYKYCFKVLWLVLVIIPILSSCRYNHSKQPKILKIYNWADYIDEDLLTEFPKWYKEQTGEDVKIVYQVFDQPEVMYTKIALGKEDFDLACPSHVIMERMLRNNLLLPIDKNIGESAAAFGNISPFIRERLEGFNKDGKKAGDYVVPYMWGTAGLLYNTKLISYDEVSSWSCMWNPKNKGKILMKDAYWDGYNVATIYGNYKEVQLGRRTLSQIQNDFTPQDFKVAEEKLKELKPNLAGWEADFGKEMMTKGKIWMNYAWSGDAVWAIEEAATVGVSLNFVVPKEGSNVWFDTWCIPKYAKNRKAASYFLAFICKPENALRNMAVSGYCSVIASPEIKEAAIDSTITQTVNLNYFFGPGNDKLHVNPIQYPDSTVVARCPIYHDFLDKNDLALELWSRAKGDSLNRPMAVSIFVFFFLLAVWLIWRRVKKYQNKRRRLKRGRIKS